MNEINPPQAEALAKFLLTVRPDWSLHYTRDAVWAMRETSTDLERITRVAIRGALSPNIAKPDVLAMGGEHWKAHVDTKPEIPRHGGRCADCGDFHGPYAPHTPRENERSTRYQEHVAQLRHELAEAKRRLCPHGVPAYACDEHSEHPAEEAV